MDREEPLPLTDAQRRRTERLFLTEAGLIALGEGLSGNAILVTFLLFIRVAAWHIPIVLSGIFLGGLIQFLGPWLLERFGSRRRFTVVFMGLRASGYFIIALIPLLLFTPLGRYYVWFHFGARVWIGTFGFMGAMGRVCWVSEVVPRRHFVMFWTRRMRMLRIVNLAGPLLGGAAVTFWLRNHHTWASVVPFFQGIFLLSALASVASWVSLLLASDSPVRRERESVRASASLLEPLRDPDYRPFLVFRLIQSTAFAFCLGLTPAYLREIKVSTAVIAGFIAGSSFLGIYFMGFWAKLTDKFGSRPTMTIISAGFSAFFMGWAFVQPGVWWLAGFVYLLLSLHPSYAAGIVPMTNKLAPPARRAAYYTAQILASLVALSIGPWASGALLRALEGGWVDLGFGRIGPIRIVLVCSGVFNILAVLALRRVPERRVRSVGRMARVVLSHSGFRPARNFQQFLVFWLAPALGLWRTVERQATRFGLTAGETDEDAEEGGPPDAG